MGENCINLRQYSVQLSLAMAVPGIGHVSYVSLIQRINQGTPNIRED
jgi:hypothetical protein